MTLRAIRTSARFAALLGACLAAHSAVVATVAIPLDQPPAAVTVQLSPQGRAEINLEGATARGVYLDSTPANLTVNLRCNGDPTELPAGVWERAAGGCALLIRLSPPPSSPMSLHLSVSIPPFPVDAIPGKVKFEEKRPLQVILTPPAPSVPPKAASVSSTPFLGGVLLLAAVAAILLYWRSRKRAPAPLAPVVAPLELAPPATIHPTDSRNGDGPTAADRHSALFADVIERLSGLERKWETAGQVREDAADAAVTAALKDLTRNVAHLGDEARRVGALAVEEGEHLRRIGRVVDEAAKLPVEKLSLVLTAVPKKALAMPVAKDDPAALIDTFESAMRQCVGQAPQSRPALVPLRETLRPMEPPLAELLEAAARMNDEELMARLSSVRDDIRNLSEELDAALSGLNGDRVSLYFRLDLSTLSTTQQSLSGELANCLRRQVLRLQDPAAYFTMHHELTIGQALQEVVDCCDTLLDPSRRMEKVQKAVDDFVRGGDAVLIAPQIRTDFLGAEHFVFGVVPCATPADRPDQICSVRVRGLKRHAQVLRKASVTIFV